MRCTIILVQLCCMVQMKYKSLLITFLGIYFITSGSAQVRPSEQEMRLREDSLKVLSSKIIQEREAADRFIADSSFTRMLVRALKIPGSFHYPFDSVESVSKLYAPDSAFRIFTWQVVRDEAMHRRHGAIQLKTTDGSLKLFPLIDRSFMIENSLDTITNNEWWIGSIYYRIVLKEFQGRKYYTLLGYDENTIRSTKKVIEVLTFSNENKPVFGGPFFSFSQDTINKPVQARFLLEYKKESNARLQFDDEMDMIIYDHLIPENNDEKKKYTYIPDGDYEGFRWQNGKWVHIEKVFTQKLKDGEAPVGMPITEDKLGQKLPPAKKPVKQKN